MIQLKFLCMLLLKNTLLIHAGFLAVHEQAFVDCPTSCVLLVYGNLCFMWFKNG